MPCEAAALTTSDDLSVDEEKEQALIRQEEEEEEEEVGGEQDEDQDSDGAAINSLEPEGNVDSEDSDDSVPARVMIRIIPKKRNKQPNSTKPKKKKSVDPIPHEEEEIEEEEDVVPEPEVIPQIDYRVLIFSLEELAKAASRREPKARMIMLPRNMEWVDVYARLKIKAIDILFPHQDVVDNNALEMTFTIPRLVKVPLPLSSAEEYNYLIKNVATMKTPAVQIIVKQVTASVGCITADKENIPPNMATATRNTAGPAVVPVASKNAKKSKAPNAGDVLPGNVAKNDKIKQLRARWECSQTFCHSEICYVPADGPHFPLGHNHLDKWAAAMLHQHEGTPSATLEHPPNIWEFDPVSGHTIVSRSPLLQARLKAAQKEKAHQAPGPVVNVVLPANYGLPIPAASTTPLPAMADSGLIPSHYAEGQKMDLPAFCSVYDVPDSVFTRLAENAITGTHAFPHITSADLTTMGFKIGEIIDLKEAVKVWCAADNCP